MRSLRKDLRIIDSVVMDKQLYILVHDPLLQGPQHGGFALRPAEVTAALMMDNNLSSFTLSLLTLLKGKWLSPFAISRLAEVFQANNLTLSVFVNNRLTQLQESLTKQGLHRHDWVYSFAEPNSKHTFTELWKKYSAPFSRPGHSLITPHVSEIKCAQITARAYSRIHLRDNIVILAPNHVTSFKRQAVLTGLPFQTPLGTVTVNNELNSHLISTYPNLFCRDDLIHNREHSVAFQLPYLQLKTQKPIITPILIPSGAQMSSYYRLQLLKKIASALYHSVNPRETTWICTGDMYHHRGGPKTERPFPCKFRFQSKFLGPQIRNADISIISTILNKRYRKYLKTLRWRNDCLPAPFAVFCLAANHNNLELVSYHLSTEVELGQRPGTSYSAFISY